MLRFAWAGALVPTSAGTLTLARVLCKQKVRQEIS
jgi:hypothetical protein